MSLAIQSPSLTPTPEVSGGKPFGLSDLLGAQKIDEKISEYLKGKMDIIDLTPEVAAFAAKFEAVKNVTDAAMNIPKTLMNIQV